MRSSYLSLPHTSSYLLTSTSPHVSATSCLSDFTPSHLRPFFYLKFSFVLFYAPYRPGICKASVFYSAFCAIVHVHVRYCGKVVPVWWEDYPRTGTLHTFVRMHLSSLPAQTWHQCSNWMRSNQDQL